MSENSQAVNPPSPRRKADRPVVAKVSILPLVKKYFKTVSMLVGVWAVGYFRFSATWMLIPPFFYILNEEYRKSKSAQKKFATEAAIDEKSAVLSRIDELPSWVFFPDVERAEWLNKVIKQMWPYIGEYVKGILKTSVEGQISNSLPACLQPFRFEKIDLGDSPPRIGGVKVYIDHIRRDEIIMDLEIFMASDTNIKVCVRGKSAGIKDLMIHGQLRVVMNLCNKIPIIGGLNVFFLNQPNVDFDLTNYANLLDMPMLSNSLRSVIQDQLNYYLVLPNKIPIQLVNSIDLQRLHYPMPQGVLRLHVVAGRELKRADFKLVGKGKSDPYCKIYIGAQMYKTKVIENTINPVWNSYFEAVVDQKHGQFAELEVLDQDPGEDDELGTASIDIENVGAKGSLDTWLPLENIETGMVHIRAIWLHLSKDPSNLEKCGGSEDWVRNVPSYVKDRECDQSCRKIHIVETLLAAVKSNQELEVQCLTEDHLSSALLIVNLDSAKSLPRGKKSMSEPSPFVKFSVGNIVKKSMPKPKTTDPKWEENFQFLVHDPRNQDLFVEVLDGGHKNKDKKLGVLSVSLKSLLTMPDMTVSCPYQLRNSGHQSKLQLRLVLRILNSEKLRVVEEAVKKASVGSGGGANKELHPDSQVSAEPKGGSIVPARRQEPAAKPATDGVVRPAAMSGAQSEKKPATAPERRIEIFAKKKPKAVERESGALKKDSQHTATVLTSEEPEDWAQDNPAMPVTTVDELAKKAAGDAAEQVVKKVAEKSAEKSVEKMMEKVTEKDIAAKEAEQAASKASRVEPAQANSNKLSEADVKDYISPENIGQMESGSTMQDPDTISNASSNFEHAGSELRRRTAQSGSSSDLGLGRMQLTLRYSSQRSRLIAVVHKCVNLVPCDEDNLADPYIRIYLLPDRSSSSKRKTQVVKNNLQPIYDETFEWLLPLNEVKQRTLDIQVKNKNSMFSKARVHMGQVVINLADTDLTKASTEWYDLEDPAEDTFKDD